MADTSAKRASGSSFSSPAAEICIPASRSQSKSRCETILLSKSQMNSGKVRGKSIMAALLYIHRPPRRSGSGDSPSYLHERTPRRWFSATTVQQTTPPCSSGPQPRRHPRIWSLWTASRSPPPQMSKTPELRARTRGSFCSAPNR